MGWVGEVGEGGGVSCESGIPVVSKAEVVRRAAGEGAELGRRWRLLVRGGVWGVGVGEGVEGVGRRRVERRKDLLLGGVYGDRRMRAGRRRGREELMQLDG